MKIKSKNLLLALPIGLLLAMVGVYYLFPDATVGMLIKAERAAGGLKPHSLQMGALRFAYLEGGQGEALVLLHGFGANKDHWTRIGRYLTPHFRVIAPDLTGFGESSQAPDGDYTVRAQAARVDGFVRALAVPSFHLGGSSMGGHIAGAYAAAHPEKIKSLVLVAPGGVASAEPSEMARRLAAGDANPLIVATVEDYGNLLDFVFFERPFIPRPIKNVFVREAIAHRPLNVSIFKQYRDPRHLEPLESRLKGLAVPTLIIWGSRDRVLHVSGAKILEAAMPKARAVVMDRVGHLPMIEKPKETAALILAFQGR